jgi:hypothetical protein
MNRINVININNIINQLKRDKKAFEIRQTLYTKTVTTKDIIYSHMTGSGLKMHELGFISRVKKHCDLIPKDTIPEIDTQSIAYISQGSIQDGDTYRHIYEVDLNAAFWEFAYKKLYIDKNLYHQGIEKVSKKARLISLGNLAKRTAIMKFDGKQFDRVQFEKSDTENIFFDVSKMTADTMSNLQFMLGEDFLFYWCDAVFVKGAKALQHIKDYLDCETLPYKVINIESLTKQEHRIIVDEPIKGARIFTFNKPIKKQPVYAKKSKIQILSQSYWSK